MNKSTDYLGQPILSQLLSLIEKPVIEQTIRSHKANYRYKKLFLWDHLVSMLYGIFTNCTSLREIQHGLEICQGKLNHLNLSHVPPRSTLSDGNKSRPAKVFGTNPAGRRKPGRNTCAGKWPAPGRCRAGRRRRRPRNGRCRW